MKVSPTSISASLLSLLPVFTAAVHAETWTNLSGGTWNSTANWSPATIPNATDAVANFSTLNITTNATVNLDGARIVGSLLFGDTTASNNWTIATGTGGPLTLDVTTGSASVVVNNQQATITAVLAGADPISVTGAGILSLQGTNTFTGDLTVGSGMTLIAEQNNAALGTVAGKTTISSGAMLDVRHTSANGLNLGDELIEFSGTGVGGLGAIINNGTQSQINAIQRATMLGDATVGGTQRFDFRSSGTGDFVDMGGFTLTKTGAGQISLVNQTINNPGNIIVNSGILGFEGTTAYNVAGSITVNAGGSLGFWAQTGVVNRPVSMNGGALRELGSNATSTVASDIALNTQTTGGVAGYVTVDVPSNSTLLNLTGTTSGSVGLYKTSPGTLQLSGTTGFTGGILLETGALRIGSAASLGSNNVIMRSNSFIEATGAPLALTLGTGAGQIRWDNVNSEAGISAATAPSNISLNGGSLTWGQQYFVQDEQALLFGALGGNNTAILTDDLALGNATGLISGTQFREVRVNDNAAGNEGQFSGVLSGNAGILKTGAGNVVLNGANTFTGGVRVLEGGVLVTPTATVPGTRPIVADYNSVTPALIGGTGLSNSTLNLIAENSRRQLIGIGANTTANLDFSSSTGANLPNAYLASAGGAFTYSGTITPNNATYKLGGNTLIANSNALTVSSVLGGANNLEIQPVDVSAAGVTGTVGPNVLLTSANTLTGTTTMYGGRLRLDGANGALANGSGIVINGTGLPGNGAQNTYTGLRGGVLHLEVSNSTDRIGAQNVTLRGGTIVGHDTIGASTITIQNLILDNGYNTLARQPQGGSAAALDIMAITNITRNFGATVDFRSQYGVLGAAGDNGQFKITNLNGTPIANTNGIVGGWAIGGGGAVGQWFGNTALAYSRDFVTYDPTNGIAVMVPSLATTSASITTATSASNVLAAGSTNNTVLGNNTLTGNLTVNSLTLESPVDVKSFTLTVGSGGIIMRQNANFLQATVAGGKLTSGMASGELFLHTPDGASNPDVRITSLGIVDNGATPLQLIKSGASKLIIGGTANGNNNTFTGGIIVNEGNLQFDFRGGTGVLPTGAGNVITVRNGGTFSSGLAATTPVTLANSVVLDGGTLRNEASGGGTSSEVTWSGGVTLAGPNLTNTFDTAANNISLTGKITGSGGFTKIGNPTTTNELKLSNATNDYAGDTYLNGGTLRTLASGALPSTTNVIVNSGTLNIDAFNQTVSSLRGIQGTSVTGTADRTLTLNQNIDTTYAGGVSQIRLIKNGTGTLSLQGNADNGSGKVTVNAGTVVFAKDSTGAVHAVGASGNAVTINSGGTVRLGGTFTNTSTTGVSVLPPGVTPNYVDQIYNDVDVDLQGGTLDMGGKSESFDKLDGSAGGLITNNVAGTLSTVYTGSNGSGGTFSGSINDSSIGGGAVAYSKLGGGTQILTGTSDFSGATSVESGILRVNGTLSNSIVTVKTGATLQGTGIINQSVIVNGGGTLAPGASPGILTTGGLTTTGASNVNFEINGLSAGNTPTSYDRMVVNGNVDLGTTAIANLSIGAFAAPNPLTNFFFLIVNDGFDPITGQFSNLAEGASVTVNGQSYVATYTGNAEANQATGGNDFALIPEPSSMLMIVSVAGGLFMRRRRNSGAGICLGTNEHLPAIGFASIASSRGVLGCAQVLWNCTLP